MRGGEKGSRSRHRLDKRMIQKNRVNGRVHTKVSSPKASVRYRVNWKLILAIVIGIGLGLLASSVYFDAQFGQINARLNQIESRLFPKQAE